MCVCVGRFLRGNVPMTEADLDVRGASTALSENLPSVTGNASVVLPLRTSVSPFVAASSVISKLSLGILLRTVLYPVRNSLWAPQRDRGPGGSDGHCLLKLAVTTLRGEPHYRPPTWGRLTSESCGSTRRSESSAGEIFNFNTVNVLLPTFEP